MSEPVKQLFRFLFFLLVQALVLSHMPPLHRFITPYIYFLFIIWLPFTTSRSAVLILSFLLGLLLDFFTKTPGLHASAALVVGYMRGFLINLLVPRETRELKSGTPGILSMGFASYALFVLLLTLFHHSWLVFLEWMTFADFWYFLGKVLLTTLVSLVLMLILELLFRPARKRRIE
ncbi:MAG TPA: rod shape-determining protein MreD [Phnomibacter sp.]|nr:rod shape-determining protein MreD [Phnomibacter sp.]